MQIAIAILVLWGGGLVLLARRQLFKPLSARLAEAALQIHPASDYYVIERDGHVVGGGAVELDTTGFAIISRQHLFGNLIAGDSDEIVIRARSNYSPRLALTGIKIELERGTDSLALTATRMRDSTLVIDIDGLSAEPAPRAVTARDPVFLPPAAALPLMLLGAPRVGREASVGVLDPLLQRIREIPLRLAAESVFVVVDSAAFDPGRGRWAMARRDTVRAWLVTSDSTAARAWVDRSGRIVEASDGRGTTARRTAYEIAYENWRIARAERAGGP